jgi:RNA polymerase sigma-70 factor, ECF subfamily
LQNSPVDPSTSWSENLAAAKRGDVNALGALLEAYWAPLWQQAALQIDDGLRSKQAASDVVQETLIEAQLHISEFRGSSPLEFQAWLRAMLANNIRDTWRRYSGTLKRNCKLEVPVNSKDDEGRLKVASNKSLLDEFLQQEKLDAVRKTLDQLPEHYREVIRMRHWDSMTFPAIGDALGKPPDTVRQLWYRAIEHFTQLLDQQDVE